MSYEPCSCPRHREERGEPVDEYDSLAWKDKAEHLVARLAAVEAERDALRDIDKAHTAVMRRCDEAEAEIEFMRAWCAEHLGGLMPPTREQNAAVMRALDETEADRG